MLAVNTLIHSISCSLVVAPCSVTFTNYKFRTQTTVDHFHRFIHGAYLAISVQVISPCSIPHKLPVPCTKNLHKPSLFNPSRLEITCGHVLPLLCLMVRCQWHTVVAVDDDTTTVTAVTLSYLKLRRVARAALKDQSLFDVILCIAP